MMRLRIAVLATAGSLSLGGCAVGGFGAIGPVASAPPPPPAPAPVAYGAFLEGPVGQKLAQADKDRALAAEQDALASGKRRTWKGDHGLFGYVEPAAATSDEAGLTCRAFTSTVYLAGRPQAGQGRGCRNADGTWTVS